jgi:hypothetical protein
MQRRLIMLPDAMQLDTPRTSDGGKGDGCLHRIAKAAGSSVHNA